MQVGHEWRHLEHRELAVLTIAVADPDLGIRARALVDDHAAHDDVVDRCHVLLAVSMQGVEQVDRQQPEIVSGELDRAVTARAGIDDVDHAVDRAGRRQQ